MKKMLMVVMACYAFTARSQVDQSKNFVYLYSDSVIYARDVSFRPDFFDSWQVRAERRKIPTIQVKFVNNEDGFFANTRKLSFIGTTSFAERIIEGKINLYKEIISDPDRYDWRHRSDERIDPTVDIRNYYNKGLGDLKKVSYVNLATDMADDAQSMGLLKTYRKSITTRNMLYSAGAVSLVASLVALMTSSKSQMDAIGNSPMHGQTSYRRPNFLPVAVLFGAGVGFGIGGFALHISSSRNLERAIETYNR